MAGSGQTRNGQRSRNGYYNRTDSARIRQDYIQGSAARKIREIPEYDPEESIRVRRQRNAREVQKRLRQKQINEATQRNRWKAAGIGRGYILFLVVMLALILGFCIQYLHLQTEITKEMKNVAGLESQLSELRENNNEYYSQVTSNLDLTAIKQAAIGRLGMRYPSDDQIVEYETEGKSYVRQYQDIPDTK